MSALVEKELHEDRKHNYDKNLEESEIQGGSNMI
jgi:hypothetical protein